MTTYKELYNKVMSEGAENEKFQVDFTKEDEDPGYVSFEGDVMGEVKDFDEGEVEDEVYDSARGIYGKNYAELSVNIDMDSYSEDDGMFFVKFSGFWEEDQSPDWDGTPHDFDPDAGREDRYFDGLDY